MTTKIYIILGLPGAGKGVCAQALKKHKNFIHLSCGEYLRRQVRQRTALGISYQDDIDSGTKLLPCEVIWSIVKQEATQAIDNNNNIVIDGFPRTEKQLVFFKEFAVEKLITPKYIYFDVDEELAIKRLLTR
jgi:adenylate kinase